MNQIHSSQKARVFFALWPGEAERNALASWQEKLHQLCGGRVMAGAGLHVTLIFLGNVGVQRLEALRLAAQEVRGEGFEMNVALARYWEHTHIVYAAPPELPPALLRLVDALDKSLQRHNFVFERGHYDPHVTLLRNAHWNTSPLPAMPPVTWRVRDFVLVQSQRMEMGARYEVLAHFSLQELQR